MERLGGAVRACSRRAVVITDTNVGPLYAPKALQSLAAAGVQADAIDFAAGEPSKTLFTLAALFDKLFALRPAIDRRTAIVALGGGVVGDMAGLLAATALRGLPWVQCPTTLLADVDASVGGKTGVDHPAGKNLIGAFHQPRAVVIDVDALATLDAANVRSGLAECVKHAVICDAELLEWLWQRHEALLACEPRTMTELVARNVAIKARVVASDEREAGARAYLNLGHTVGHAVETLLGYGGVTHGQAVALGMMVACKLSERRGLMTPAQAERVSGVLERLGLETRRSGLDAEAILNIVQHDKKARAGVVRMVLPRELGAVELLDVGPQELRGALAVLE
jgi:3-dehydroquinate synthase